MKLPVDTFPISAAPPPEQARLPETALEQWRRLLGPKRVLGDAEHCAQYNLTTLAQAPTTRAVLRPEEAAQIPDILHIAREYRIPIYPISRGRNWGWGDACPVAQGQVILDLGDLDRIVEIDDTLGYAVIEPGVTQGQLARELAARAPGWWLESTNAGAETSIIGNTLERGLGVGERTESMCGIEVVLPDGKVLQTGFGTFPRSRVAHLAKWGVGPSPESLFCQSNLGIVTRMGIWLAPRPEGAECCMISTPADTLPQLIDALRPLRLRGVLPTNVHVFPAIGADGESRWLAVGAIYGPHATRAAYRQEIRSSVSGLGRTAYFERIPSDMTETLSALALASTPGIGDLFRAGAALCTGAPFTPGPDFLLAYLGGAGVQGKRAQPTSADPLENGYGFYFHWMTCPATGADVTEAMTLVGNICAGFGFKPQMTLQLPNGRAAVLVIRLCFNRSDDSVGAQARRCYRRLINASVDAGFPPWRLGIEGMSLLKQSQIDLDFTRGLKRWMDPESILAPGRYVW
ncbi:MAG: FAD-binding oxidoreductase [Gammaproteobacteria bacterium]